MGRACAVSLVHCLHFTCIAAEVGASVQANKTIEGADNGGAAAGGGMSKSAKKRAAKKARDAAAPGDNVSTGGADETTEGYVQAGSANGVEAATNGVAAMGVASGDASVAGTDPTKRLRYARTALPHRSMHRC